MSKEPFAADSETKTALVLDPRDNVAVALTALHQGDRCTVRYPEDRHEKITAVETIAFGHKIALRDFQEHEPVLKYGEEIGKMSAPLRKGGWVHNHNMYCERGLK
ncbi:UxaA family hydrolase [Paenibacillus thalictri]|uniref:Altronate dehydratase n=1 Tax=Paenibacillus thalictri TaxID=2527873 RepID=A0A4Q9DP22_9BACL|nr:UxaA family hydrolase [Paenibacillus thalictri]TBL77854.1 altronate dehydratase [Paenibacillus thalictri]